QKQQIPPGQKRLINNVLGSISQPRGDNRAKTGDVDFRTFGKPKFLNMVSNSQNFLINIYLPIVYKYWLLLYASLHSQNRHQAGVHSSRKQSHYAHVYASLPSALI